MKIISKYNDCYDYLQYIYGADDRAVYYRDITNTRNTGEFVTGYVDERTNEYIDLKVMTVEPDDHIGFPDCWYRSQLSKYSDCCDSRPYLVICGKIFKLVALNENGELYVKGNPYLKYKQIKYEIFHPDVHSRLYTRTWYQAEYNMEREPVVDLCKKVKLLVFMIWNTGTKWTPGGRCKLTVDIYNPPLLSTVRIDRVYSPEKLYQDIEYYLLNIINESPDVLPAGNPPMTNKEKIISKGFDYKKSFRHRK